MDSAEPGCTCIGNEEWHHHNPAEQWRWSPAMNATLAVISDVDSARWVWVARTPVGKFRGESSCELAAKISALDCAVAVDQLIERYGVPQ